MKQKTNTNTNTNMLDLLAKAVSFTFKDDKTSPGITVSQIKDGTWYASAVRYKKAFAKGEKEVAFKARGETSTEALTELAKQIVAATNTPKNPVEELANFVSN
jgi:hypothetical protein